METLESLLASVDGQDENGLFDEEVRPENIDHIPADDTVSLYFRQMASEPLLSAEQEVALAKRIERGSEASRLLEEEGKLTLQPVQMQLYDGTFRGRVTSDLSGFGSYLMQLMPPSGRCRTFAT